MSSPGATDEIAIYSDSPLAKPWAPTDIATKGLAGSQTASIRLAAGLRDLGYTVEVYGHCPRSRWAGVDFLPLEEYDPARPRLATVASRAPELFDIPTASLVRLLWLHDMHYGDRLTAARAEHLHHVLVLSAWHGAYIGASYPYLRPKLRRVPNGVTPELFAGEAPIRRRQVVYSSAPARGLDALLDVWPRVRERVPDAELLYCAPPVYGEGEDEPGREGVRPLGSLSQPQLVQLMRSSLVWAHPSWRAKAGKPFLETSCIGAMEAQAAGCVVVASRVAALGETVRVGRLVSSTPAEDRWADEFADAVVAGLTDPALQQWSQVQGPEAMRGMTWDSASRIVAALIEETAVRSSERERPRPSPSAGYARSVESSGENTATVQPQAELNSRIEVAELRADALQAHQVREGERLKKMADQLQKAERRERKLEERIALLEARSPVTRVTRALRRGRRA